MFLYAQALSTWVIRCLVNSFDEDWEWRDGSSVPRKLQLPLIMIPLVVCGVVSAFFSGAMLLGVLWRLATFWNRWRRGLPFKKRSGWALAAKAHLARWIHRYTPSTAPGAALRVECETSDGLQQDDEPVIDQASPAPSARTYRLT
jgi:hypothetical protein